MATVLYVRQTFQFVVVSTTGCQPVVSRRAQAGQPVLLKRQTKVRRRTDPKRVALRLPPQFKFRETYLQSIGAIFSSGSLHRAVRGRAMGVMRHPRGRDNRVSGIVSKIQIQSANPYVIWSTKQSSIS